MSHTETDMVPQAEEEELIIQIRSGILDPARRVWVGPNSTSNTNPCVRISSYIFSSTVLMLAGCGLKKQLLLISVMACVMTEAKTTILVLLCACDECGQAI